MGRLRLSCKIASISLVIVTAVQAIISPRLPNLGVIAYAMAYAWISALFAWLWTFTSIVLLVLVCIEGASTKKPLIIIGAIILFGFSAIIQFVQFFIPSTFSTMNLRLFEIVSISSLVMFPVGMLLLSIDAFIDKQKKVGALALVATVLLAMIYPVQGLMLVVMVSSLGWILAGIFLFMRDPKSRVTPGSPKNVLIALA